MRRDRLLREHLLERFVVTLDDGTTFVGLLHSVDENTVCMVDAAVMGAGTQRTPVDGELYLDRFRIAFMQRP